MRILIQFIGQGIGLIILRKSKNANQFPYQMPFFPFPIYIAIAMWLFIFFSTGTKFIIGGLAIIFSGIIIYFIKAKMKHDWPFYKNNSI